VRSVGRQPYVFQSGSCRFRLAIRHIGSINCWPALCLETPTIPSDAPPNS
jgi:hypothetical protein